MKRVTIKICISLDDACPENDFSASIYDGYLSVALDSKGLPPTSKISKWATSSFGRTLIPCNWKRYPVNGCPGWRGDVLDHMGEVIGKAIVDLLNFEKL